MTEGTWMSLDVSPDGKTIVFDLLGDLYTLPIGGGKARRITSGTAYNQQPSYSPDGSRLAFISDLSGSPQIWVTDRNGEHGRQLSRLRPYMYDAPVASPTWSPDGRVIVASQRLGASRLGTVSLTQDWAWLLAAYTVATGSMRWVTDTTPDHARPMLGPAFSPDGRVIYAAAQAYVPWIDRGNPWRIQRIDLFTGHAQPELAVEMGRGGMRPAVSSDGRFLVYASSSGTHTGLRVRDLRTDRERWLVRELLDDPPLHVPGAADSRDLVPGYAFTPDSRSVVITFGGKIHRVDIATGRAEVIPFEAQVERVLPPLVVHQFQIQDTPARTRSVMQPALSPDGRSVAFSALDRIWIMDLSHESQGARQPRRLTADSVGEFYPSWSPDGRWIAYSTWKDGEGGAIRRATVLTDAGTAQENSEPLTTEPALYFNTAVSPDGKRVAVVRAALPAERVLTHSHRHSADSLTLVWIPAEGGAPHTVTSLDAVKSLVRSPIEQLYFTNDSTRIFVGATSWKWDGTDRRKSLTIAPGEDSSPLLADITSVIAPDGRRALVTWRYTLFEIELAGPASHGEDTLELDTAPGAGIKTGGNHRWGPALAPWMSWSRDGSRALFAQGGTLFVRDVQGGAGAQFERVDVPLMIPVDVPDGSLLLHGARLITMRERSGERVEVIQRGDLLVRKNRIVALGAAGTLAVPPGTPAIDFTGKTILPGYVDIHDHVAIADGVHGGQDFQWLLRLSYGITAIRDPWPSPTFYNDIFAYRERERAGDLVSPRIFTTGIAHLRTDRPVQDLTDARAVVRPYAEYFGTETFKEYNGSEGRHAHQLIGTAARESGLNATVHSSGAGLGLTYVLDGYSGLEHSPQIKIYNDVALLIARSGTTHTQTYNTTLGWNYMVRRFGAPWEWPTMRRFVPPSAREAAWPSFTVELLGPAELDNLLAIVSGAGRIAAQGGRMGMGSHGDVPGIGFHYEMWFHALGGVPNREVLRSATILGAAAIGHKNDFGSLAPGKLADLQVLNANPLDDIHNTVRIDYVMKNGRLYRAADLTEVSPACTPLAATYQFGVTPNAETQTEGRARTRPPITTPVHKLRAGRPLLGECVN